MNLAERLLRAGVLTQDQLTLALHRQKKFRGFLAQHLLELDFVEKEVLTRFLSPYPVQPQSLEELGLPEHFLLNLLLKHCLLRTVITARELAQVARIPESLAQSVVESFVRHKFLEVKPRDVNHPVPTHLAGEFRYTLTDLGKQRGSQEMEFNSYVGPAPVPLQDYWDWVEIQTISQVEVEADHLRKVFADLVLPEGLFHRVGPAIFSGRAIFLFGPSGNGKTIMSLCIGEAFDDTIFIPYALYVDGQIIRVFDEHHHQTVTPPDLARNFDSRWVPCRRPVIVAGGEMTEDSLELRFNPILKYYEAPPQLRANNGVFIIDDFGRQKISPRQLLNRWMYPLENQRDFLSLHTGQQFGIPFDQLVIFCTNLDPYSLADAAFLRRIRHKIFIDHVTPEQYLEIFRRVCEKQEIHFDAAAVRHIVRQYHVEEGRPLDACHPRDLVDILVDRARFLREKPQLTTEALEYACRSYFVLPKEVTDYDVIPDRPHLLP